MRNGRTRRLRDYKQSAATNILRLSCINKGRPIIAAKSELLLRWASSPMLIRNNVAVLESNPHIIQTRHWLRHRGLRADFDILVLPIWRFTFIPVSPQSLAVSYNRVLLILVIKLDIFSSTKAKAA